MTYSYFLPNTYIVFFTFVKFKYESMYVLLALDKPGYFEVGKRGNPPVIIKAAC